MEDFKGDVQTGCKTMPIVWGVVTSKVVVFFVIVLIIIFLLIASIHYYKYHHLIKIYYIITFAILPLLVVIFKTAFAKTSKDFKSTSLLLKFVMLAGICFTVLFYIF